MTQHKKPVKDWLFRQIHTNNLVYNTCWEDPRCDRELLNIDEKSESPQLIFMTALFLCSKNT